MINKTLALVRRALSVDARDARPHLFRAALGAVVLFTLVSIHTDQFSRSAPGLDLFKWVCYYNYWFITVAGASFFATAVTEEKEERTIGLLKMAGVGSAALLLGKWIPRLTGAFLLIAIQIPFTVLAITLGGVLWNQIGAAYLALFAHLFLVGNLGLLASVVSARTSAACGLTVLVLFLFHVLPFLLQSAATAAFRQGTLPAWLYETVETVCEAAIGMCALWRITGIVSTGFNEPWVNFQVMGNVVVGGVLLGIAWWLFEPFTRNEIEPGESKWLSQMRHIGRLTKERRVWSTPLVWKDFHYLGGGLLAMVVKFAAIAGLILIFALMAADWRWARVDAQGMGGIAIMTSLFLLVLETAVIVTRVYRTEMTQQTWSTLTLLPKSLPEIAYPKLFGAFLALVPGLSFFVLGVLLLPDETTRFLEEMTRRAESFLGFSYFWLQILLAIHLAAWFSIVLRWGVWPLAIFMAGFAVFMGNMMLMTCLFAAAGVGARDGTSILFMLCCFGVVLNGTVHYLIGRRLSAMAAE